jgi:hypothetical protein
MTEFSQEECWLEVTLSVNISRTWTSLKKSKRFSQSSSKPSKIEYLFT